MAYNLPVSYLWENLYNADFSPSTVHGDSKLTVFFSKYLFQKAISPFKFTIPDSWPLNYFLYTLYARGLGCIFEVPEFGTIYQDCTISGYNLYYQPRRAVVANPVLFEKFPEKNWELEIGTECALIHIEPDYSGILDLVTFYADQLALFSEAIGMNIQNSKLAFVFAAKNQAIAESFKKLFDKVQQGEPAVVAGSELFNSQGQLLVDMFNRDIKSSYIITDLLDDMRTTEERFLTEIGIPNANTDKRERLITSEVESNNFETRSKCEVWMDTLKRQFKEANKMYPDLNLKVEWRDRNATVDDSQRPGTL